MKKRLNLEMLFLLCDFVSRDFDYSATAKAYNITEQGVKVSLKKLEDQLGARLYHRTKSKYYKPTINWQSIRLTPAGRRLVTDCSHFFVCLPNIEERAIAANHPTPAN